MESILGNVQDISEYIEFDFHVFIKFYDPHKGEQLGRWLGVCKNIGTGMVYYILQQNGYVISRSTIRNLSKEEWLNENEHKQRDEFEEEEYKILGSFDESLVHLAANNEMEEPLTSDIPAADVNPGNDEVYSPNELTGMEVYFSHGDHTEIAKVLGRKRNAEGTSSDGNILTLSLTHMFLLSNSLMENKRILVTTSWQNTCIPRWMMK